MQTTNVMGENKMNVKPPKMVLRINVEKYQNREITARYKDKLNLNGEQADQLFMDVKRFLFICHVSDFPCVPSRAIDDGWHEFILYTGAYARFCKSMFGHFIHHRPNSYFEETKGGRQNFKRTIKLARKHFGELGDNWGVRPTSCCDWACGCDDDDIKAAECCDDCCAECCEGCCNGIKAADCCCADRCIPCDNNCIGDDELPVLCEGTENG